MTDTPPVELPAAAKCGAHYLDGACWRPGDPAKHLGPPTRLAIPVWSALWQTRCGLPSGRRWRTQPRPGTPEYRQATSHQDDDYWCPPCLTQAGITYQLYED